MKCCHCRKEATKKFRMKDYCDAHEETAVFDYHRHDQDAEGDTSRWDYEPPESNEEESND